MPFVAKHKETGDRLDITTVENPKGTLKSGDYLCQLCSEPLIVRTEHYRRGFKVNAHFAHHRDCNSQYDAHPESAEHRWAKLYLREQLRQFYSKWSTSLDIQLEVPIAMDWRARGRIADVLVSWPLGWREAHEIQLAPITIENLKDRTNDYRRAGIDVIWWLGKSADNYPNRAWCMETFGESYSIQWFETTDELPHAQGVANGLVLPSGR